MNRLLRTITFLVILLFTSTAQGVPNDRHNQIDLPQGTIEGHLANGLRYIILPNNHPKHNLEIRLVVNAGTLQETNRQRGSAHMVEHMAFNGSTHFPVDSWTSYFKRLGMVPGHDMLATTGFNHTVYQLSLPVADFGYHVISNSLFALRDIIGSLSFDPKRMETERRAIINEAMNSSSLDDKFQDLKLGKGRHLHRKPTGTIQETELLTREEVLKYYHKWYIPQNVTLVVVGDMDAVDMEKCVKTVFGELPVGDRSIHRKYPLTYRKGFTLAEAVDTTAARSRLTFAIPHPSNSTANVAATAEKEQWKILVTAIDKRLKAKQINASIVDKTVLDGKNMFFISVEGNNRRIIKSYMNSALITLNTIIQRGFSHKELADNIAEKLRTMRVDTVGTASAIWCDYLTDYAISGNLPVTSSDDMARIRDIVEHTTSATLQRMLSDLINNKHLSVLAAYRNHKGRRDAFNERHLRHVWQRGMKAHTYTYKYQRRPEVEERHLNLPPCLSATHPDASPASASGYADIGASEYLLKNGLRLILRPTTDRDSTLRMTLLGRGGYADLDPNSRLLLMDADKYVDMGGLQNVPEDTLIDVMQTDNITMTIAIDDYWHQLKATAPCSKPQLLMNMAYEKITAPGRAYENFDRLRQEEKDCIMHESKLQQLRTLDPQRMLIQCIDSIARDTPSTEGLKHTAADLDQLDLDHMCYYYTRLFTDPEHTTIIFTGHFNPKSVLRAAANTFGRLTSSNMGTFTDKPVYIPEMNFRKTFPNTTSTQTELHYVFPGNYLPELKESAKLAIIRGLLQQRLQQRLEGQLKIASSPDVKLSKAGYPQQKYHFLVKVTVRNEDRQTADKAVRETIRELQQTPVAPTELQQAKMNFLVQRRKLLADNAPIPWMEGLTSLLQNGETLAELNRFAQYLKAITPADMQQAFTLYLSPERMALICKGMTVE